MILLLINEGQAVYQKIKNQIFPEDFKNQLNREIVKVLYSELEKGEISDVIGLFEKNEDLLSHITYIMSNDSEISDIEKAVEDLSNKFIKEKLQDEKIEILRSLVLNNLDKEEEKKKENRLKEISKKLVNLK